MNVSKKIIALFLLILFSLSAQAQVTREDYARAEQFLQWNAEKLIFKTRVEPNWIEKSDRFWYRNDIRNGKEFVLIDPDANTRRLAFDHIKLAQSLSRTTGKAYEDNKLPFDRFDYVENGRSIQFDIDKTTWTCNLTSYECIKTQKKISEGELLSPDGRWAAFVKNYNLFVRSLDKGEEIQLTADGEQFYDYASPTNTTVTVITEPSIERKPPPVVLWSPDSKKLVTHRLDQRKAGKSYLIQSVLPKAGARPVLHTLTYPLPGDKNRYMVELIIFDIEQKKKIPVDYEPMIFNYQPPLNNNNYVWWSEDSEKVYFIQEELGYKSNQLHVANAKTGATRTILKESGSTYVELNLRGVVGKPNVRIIKGGAEVIWFSERDGWAHLYLYDSNTGSLKSQITSGNWIVRDIMSLDEKIGWLYFTASGYEKERDPYYQHLYRTRLDGSNMQLLTPENAEHTITFSPQGRYFLDTYSRVDTFPISVLRSAEGKLVRVLEEADAKLLIEAGWKKPEMFSVKARDGITDLYGVIYHPSNFDQAKKYPVLDSIYPGPQIIRSSKSFSLDRNGSQPLAELGFVVVTIDGMGTPFRSKAFHDVSYGRMEEAGGLEDHIIGLRQLAATHPYMDLGRVGIYGHSGGGFASTHAMLTYPDFYKVAVSSAGNHDQRSYQAWWGEKYQGLPVGENYRDQSNISLARNLKGKLFLVMGDMDDNVNPAATIQLVDALVKANKDFDLLIIPNYKHNVSTSPYFIRKQWDYFVKHLLGQEPPKEYQIVEPKRVPPPANGRY